LRDYEAAEPLAAQALQIAEKNEFPWLTNCRCAMGAILSQSGRVSEGVTLIRDGINQRAELGVRNAMSIFDGYLIAAQEIAGVVAEALETVERALQANPNELVYRPGVLRLRGGLERKQGRFALARANLVKQSR
jgi:hypothetical protein